MGQILKSVRRWFCKRGWHKPETWDRESQAYGLARYYTYCHCRHCGTPLKGGRHD